MMKHIFFAAALLLASFPILAQNASATQPQTPSEIHSSSPSSCPGPGCIVSNDQSTIPREAGAEGQTLDTRGQDIPPVGVTPDLDTARRPETPRTPQRPTLQPAEQATDFEKYVQDTTGHVLPVFGRDLFLNTPADFLPATSVSPPADYVVGSGDQVKIRAWGNVNIDVLVTVDRNGQIFIPQIGSLSVAGMRVDQMQEFIRSAMGAQFKNVNLSATLGQLRSIQVFVLGQARRPGVYTVSSLSTLVNALFTSGGPSASGSMRDIQVKREGKVVTHFDIYNLLLQGDKSKDVHLLPGDILFIPVIGPQIAIDGDVTKPGIYELTGSTTAEAALGFAGGLTPIAGLERASLDRILDHSQRTVEEFPLNGPQRLITVQDGDILRIFPISAKIEKAVTLRGSIGAPGRYPWHPGMRVTDLIPNRQFLLTRNFFNKQNAPSTVPTDRPFGVSNQTESAKAGTSALLDNRAATVASANEAIDTQAQTDLVSHETEINWNYAAIERLSSSNLKTQIISFALGEAVDHPSSPENRPLEPGDVVVIYTRNDLNLPTELRARFVRIDGEVSKPGIYQIEDNETLRNLVQRAGGIAPHGYPYAAQLTRESVRISEELKLQSLIRQESRSALSPINNPPSSSDGKGGANDFELRKAYIAALSQIHANGRVTLQISPTASVSDGLPEFLLQDGDHLFVPAKPNTVDVLGNVYNQGSLRYIFGGHVSNYLKAAGGHTREGDKASEFVLRADGTVLSRQQSSRFEKLLIYPGDSVIVPARLRPGFSAYELLNFSQVLSGFALTALAIKSLQ